MRAARTSGRERAAALRLARGYAVARDSVAQAPSAPAGGTLPASLGAAALAFRRLARAAATHDAHAFRAARVTVARAERAFARALAPLAH